MKVVIVNDDGAYTEGLSILHNTAISLFGKDNVFVVVPRENQSGASHSISTKLPVNYIKIDHNKYLCDGTPADCAWLASEVILKDQPIDLVLSGINAGHNATFHAWYSGTISGAREGIIMGAKVGIAISQAGLGDLDNAAEDENRIDWTTSHMMVKPLLEIFIDAIENGTLDGKLLNINLPPLLPSDDLDKYKKINENNTIVAGKLGRSIKSSVLTVEKDGTGGSVNWRKPVRLQEKISINDNGDFAKFSRGYATVSLAELDIAEEKDMKLIKSILFGA